MLGNFRLKQFLREETNRCSEVVNVEKSTSLDPWITSKHFYIANSTFLRFPPSVTFRKNGRLTRCLGFASKFISPDLSGQASPSSSTFLVLNSDSAPR